MRILSPISDDAAGEVGFALIDIPPSLAKEFLDLRKKCKPVFGLRGIYGVDIYEHTPVLHYRRDEDFQEDLDNGSWMEAPEDWESGDGNVMSTSTSTMTIKPSGLIWRLYSKHSSEVFETCEIGWDTIEEIAKATEAAPKAKKG